METPPKKITILGFENRLFGEDAIAGYNEKRGSARIAHSSRVKIKVLKSGVLINARMRHYNENGLYVEANRLLLPRSAIYIGLAKAVTFKVL